MICATALGDEVYHFVREIPIGGEGGWDILTIDNAARRLYLAHSTKVVVVDLNKNAAVGEVANTPGVHAFVAVPELQRGFSSNGKESKSSVVDLTTLKTTWKIDTGPNPDAVGPGRSSRRCPPSPPRPGKRRRPRPACPCSAGRTCRGGIPRSAGRPAPARRSGNAARRPQRRQKFRQRFHSLAVRNSQLSMKRLVAFTATSKTKAKWR